MLHYLIQKPAETSSSHRLIVLLHGYGSNEDDLFSFASELPKDAYVVSFRAPHTLMYGSYAWYAIHFDATSSDKFSDIPQAKESLQLIKNNVTQLSKELAIDKDKITLIGFSQGAILSYALAFSFPEMFNKIVALSGYFNQDMCEQNYLDNDLSKIKIFASHGSDDQVIPVSWARQSKDFLLTKHINVTYKEYPVGHGVAPQNFMDFRAWLEQ